jgi:hypothetical protein
MHVQVFGVKRVCADKKSTGVLQVNAIVGLFIEERNRHRGVLTRL